MVGGVKYPKWEVKAKETADVAETLLINRGLTTKKERDEFFNPPSPLQISLKEVGLKSADIKKFSQILAKVKKNREKIIVYGDYDADGICATAILWEALYSLSFDALPYIPERVSEGYGLRAESVGVLKEKYPNLGLVITVDNGITANVDIKAIGKLGIGVVVVDHHQLGQQLPLADLIIHTTDLCAAGIVWFVARELGYRKSLLELVTIATIADQMPLVGVNRALVRAGLKNLTNTKRLGLQCLLREAGIEGKTLGTYEVNYLIAPRINATGRMGQGIDSLRLLCTKDAKRANLLAKQINQINQQRQKVVEESLLLVKKEFSNQNKVIIVSGQYHEGIVGLLAGKLTEEFGRPSIVFSVGESIAKASARSVKGVNIIAMIHQFDELLVGGGGHPMAAGFSLKRKHLELFTQKFTEYLNREVTDEMLGKKLVVDMILPGELVTQKLAVEIARFEPFGMGNPTPLFLAKDVLVVKASVVGSSGYHLKLVVKIGDQSVGAIAFNFSEVKAEELTGKKIDLVFSLEENIWNGKTSLQLKVKDIFVSSRT